MELHQLRYFLAVADEGTFTAAAAAVRISQSGVSTQLQKLERELGVTLLDRSARRVALTPAGHRLLPVVRNALAAVDGVQETADDIRGLVTGTLRVATVTGLAWPRLFDALAKIHREHPGVDLRLREGVSDELVGQVRDGTVDVAVAAWSGAAPNGVRSAIVVDDPLVAVVAHDHAWRRRSRVTADDLADADLISLAPGTGARSALDAIAGRNDPRWEVSSPSYVRVLASRGIGVGVVSETTAQGWDDVHAVRIDDPLARSILGVVWRDVPSHAAQALLSLVVPSEVDSRRAGAR